MRIIENVYSGSSPFDQGFTERGETQEWIDRMGSVISTQWKPVYESGDSNINRMINEGLEKLDLEGIMLPRVSIDEYLPADADSDNIVIAFFIKGVPEAVIPFRDFLQKCNGVLDVDYGDSDTIVNTSVTYAEMDRENFDIKDLRDIMIQVSMLSGLAPDDFTVTFPHTSKKFPFSMRLINTYFQSRTKKDNLKAQDKARRDAEKEKQKELNKIQTANRDEEMQGNEGQHGEGTEDKTSDEARANESTIQHMIGLMIQEDK